MLPYTPPLWLTVTFVAVVITANLITIISKKIVTERLNDKQNNEPYTKNAAYWIHAIVSRIAIIVNLIAGAVIISLLFCGVGWISIYHPYIFWAMMCIFIWIASLGFTCFLFRMRNKSPDSDNQDSDTLVDPKDRTAINYAIAWILGNITLDVIMWLTINIQESVHY